MIDQTLHFLQLAGEAVNLFAVAVIIAGFILASVRYALRSGQVSVEQNFTGLKIELGHALTLALEILIIGDVIETITVEPSLTSLGVLAFLVAIRTLLSWTLCLEIDGCWPWQSATEGPGDE